MAQNPSPGAPPRLTSPDKLIFPDARFTKRDLADYLDAGADAFLPQLRDRPVTRVRFPDGVAGERLFQRHVGRGAPGWVRTARLRASPVDMGREASSDPGSSALVVSPVVDDDDVWFAAAATDWKVAHVRHQPEVSVTVPVRRGGLLALVAPIPPATVTFRATAQVVPVDDAPEKVRRRLLRGLAEPDDARGAVVMVRLTPHGDFVTYGLGVPLRVMVDTERARGRVPVARS